MLHQQWPYTYIIHKIKCHIVLLSKRAILSSSTTFQIQKESILYWLIQSIFIIWLVLTGIIRCLLTIAFLKIFFFWVAFCFFYNFMSFIGYGASFIERKKNIKINYRTSFMYFSSIYSIFFIKQNPHNSNFNKPLMVLANISFIILTLVHKQG